MRCSDMVNVKRTRRMEASAATRQEQSPFLRHLAEMRVTGELCDCVLVSAEGTEYQAHRVVLAAASLFFKALYAGSGQQMLDSSTTNDQGQYRVQLCNMTGQGLELTLAAMYQQELQASAHLWSKLIRLSSCLLHIQNASTDIVHLT